MPHLPEWRLDAIAIWMIEGHSTKEIASIVKCDESTIRRLGAGDNEKFNTILEGYRQQVISGMVHHKIRLIGMLETTYVVGKRSLEQEKDPRLAWDAAKDVWDRLFANPRKEQSAHQGLQININHPQVQAEVHQITTGAADFLRSLKDVPLSVTDPREDRHLLDAKEALPSAISAVDAQERDEDEASGNGKERQVPVSFTGSDGDS